MNHYTEAMIATRGVLSEAQFAEVSKQVRNIVGVRQVTRSRKIPRVIWVTYHTGKTRALAILNGVTRSGFKASLIGM